MSASLLATMRRLEEMGATAVEILAAARELLEEEERAEEASREAEYAEHVARVADPFASAA